jgi:hypothetical protein
VFYVLEYKGPCSSAILGTRSDWKIVRKYKGLIFLVRVRKRSRCLSTYTVCHLDLVSAPEEHHLHGRVLMKHR